MIQIAIVHDKDSDDEIFILKFNLPFTFWGITLNNEHAIEYLINVGLFL